MGRTPKIDRARRNALKAAGLVLGTVLATGVPHKQASAQSQPVGDVSAFLTFFATSFLPQTPRPAGNPGNLAGAAVVLRGARRSGRARAIGRSKRWRWATRLRCVSGASRRSRQWSVTP